MIWREARERVGVAAITGEMARIAAAVPPNVPIRLTNSAWHSARYGSWNRDSDFRRPVPKLDCGKFKRLPDNSSSEFRQVAGDN